MKILLLSKYGRLGASSRLRSYQYIPYLEKQGILVDNAPLLGDEYLRKLYSAGNRPLMSIAKSYLQRLWNILRFKHYDLLWIEKELFPWMPAIAESCLRKFGVKYVVDYDDAIFHQYDLHPNPLVRMMLQKKIDKVMRHATLVIVGNDYLAKRASQAGARWVEILPTVIDIERYTLSGIRQNNGFYIGWIGTPMTAKYIYQIKDALVRICLEKNAKLLLIGLEKIDIEGVPVQTFPWDEKKEVELIKMFDVGIMPLQDGAWEKGKCGYKLIQYMACSLPVIASPVGANMEIVDHGVNGYLASTETEWLESFRRLQQDKRLRTEMGKAGRAKVEKKYCLQVTAPRFVELLEKVASK